MNLADERLIQLLKVWILDSFPLADEVSGFGPRRFPPASLAAIEKAEIQLGFVLPSLLRMVYASIANGWSGFIGLEGGEVDEWENSLPSRYKMVRLSHPAYPQCSWPEGLVPLKNWGCNIWSCMHCQRMRNPIVRFDPNLIEYDDYPKSFAESFSREAGSLRSWLKAYAERRVAFGPPFLRPRDETTRR